MYFHLSFFIAICLVVVSGAVANAGFHGFPFNRDLHLAEELGLDLKLLFEDRARFLALVAHIGDKDIDAEYTTMPIDHWNSSVGTYQNRYWVEDKHYRPGGPVFVYDAGETSADVFVQSQFKKPSILQQLLKEFHGMGIIWEHRYYGDSLPFPVGEDTPPEHLQYLTTEQALADIPHFAKTFRRNHCRRHDLTPQSTPWIMVGGSYPGARAAFTRNKYPDTIYAAYASSATVHAQVNLSAYYDQVYRGMIAHGYASCVKDIQAALEYIDDQLSNDEAASAIKQLFFGEGAESNSNGDFTAALAGIYGFFQAYGTERPEIGSLHDFCSHLETDPQTHSQASADGLASIYGNKFVAERFAAWPIFTPLVNLNFGTNCGGLNGTIPAVCKLGRAITSPDDISWTWQYCTEWGVFQVDNPGPRSLLSRYQSVEYFQSICNQQFPEAFKSGLLPPHPQAETLNGETGGWSIRPSNVYWTSGEFDPWRPLSTLSTEQSCPTVSYSTDIPACGEPQVDRLFGFIMKDAEHCFDFRMNFEPGATAREHFVRALRKWLPCFKGKGGGRWNHHWA